MKNLGISSIYAVDKQKQLLGVIHAADAKKAVESDLSLQDILNTEFTTVHESTYLTEIFDVVSDANIPIAVTDDTPHERHCRKRRINRRAFRK